MSAVWTWIRHDVRRSWLSLAVIAVLVALVVGTGATALAGARRGASATDRLQHQTLGMNALIAANPSIHYRWAEFDKLPYVDARWGLVATPGVRAKGVAGSSDDWLTTPADDAFGSTIERPAVLAGRMYHPDIPNELVITREFATKNHVDVGDALDVRLPTEDQARKAVAQSESVADPQGPRVKWKVVGVVVSPWLLPESISPEGKAALSPATLASYSPNLLGGMPVDQLTVVSMFRLHDPGTDVAKLTTDARRLAHSSDVDVWNVGDRYLRPARDSARFEATPLAAFGLLALLAGVFLVGSTIARSSAAEAIDLRKALAIGMTPRQVTFAAATATALAAATGAVLGAMIAIVASAWFPIGSTRLVEPDPGVSFDWLVLPLVTLAVVFLMAGVALVSARRQIAAGVADRRVRTSALAARLSDLSTPVPVVMGTRLALEPSAGRNAVPVRPAQVGAVLAVLGTIAVLVLSAGISDALSHPRRFGQVQQLDAFVGYDSQTFLDADKAVASLRALPYVKATWNALEGNATADGGQASLIVYSGDTGPSALTPTLFDGRLPTSTDEIFLAVRTARTLHASLGDQVRLTGSAATRSMRVTGVGFVPNGPHNGYADGGWVSQTAYPTLFGKAFHFHLLFVSSDGLTTHEFARRLATDLPTSRTGLQFTTPNKLDAVAQLRTARKFPVALAAFLGILGIGVVANALILAVRRRVGELAVLRAIGMTGRQTATTVHAQALVLVLVGLAFGIPLGLATGRLAWREVASFVPLEYVPPQWGSALLYVSATALALGVLLALAPARRAARFHIAAVLRAE